MNNSPLSNYLNDLKHGKIIADPQQEQTIQILQLIFEQLSSSNKTSKIFQRFRKTKRAIPGLYMYGPVGSGKTYLLDTFYKAIPKRKMRRHFHEFMREIHSRLKSLVGEKNPLNKVAKDLAKKNDVICFDEFFVSNIVDAMLLGNLLKALFKQGICLVATSNIEPDDLYKNGLQRDLFLPAIAILKQNVRVLQVDNHIDYRLQHLTPADVYFYPLNENNRRCLARQFDHFSHGIVHEQGKIELLGREIAVIKRSDNAIWFDFKVICQVPRSQYDYLELVRQYDTIVISDVPVITDRENNVISLFISLVDVAYNAGAKLIISAQAPIVKIYTQGELLFDFQRAKSRLIEMQSEKYTGEKNDNKNTFYRW
ncbi:MAG: cell division protein ZapE [Pseudomonadota bacterium]